MRRKINLNFMLVIAVSVFLTVSFTALVSYRFFQREVFSDLSSFADMIERLGLAERMRDDGFVEPLSELRITWIQADGRVLYDSYARDPASAANHSDRPEVAEALEKGEGFCVRKSQTMGESIFFFARRMEDGTVIRIAKKAGSIWHMYGDALPVTLLIAALSFLISMWVARALTRAFVRPIAELAEDMDRLENPVSYRELAPFIERIRAQHEQMMENTRMRQEFTANVSHELKTPLTAISGYAELIATGMASKKESRHFAEEIHKSARRLLSLINDILRLSELEGSSGQLLSFEAVDICGLAGECVRTLVPVAEKQEVCLTFQGTPLPVRADRGLLEELVFNLCDNAIRYNKKGGHVWVTVTDRLIVQDDGIGIPAKYQKRVFERFFRVDKGRSRKMGGTGLGLAIVKHIAQVHGAVISLDSDEGMGTTVSVAFPDPEISDPE